MHSYDREYMNYMLSEKLIGKLIDLLIQLFEHYID